MRQSAQVQHDGESSNAAAWAPAEDVDQFDRGFAYVAAVCMAAVAAMAALAVLWPAS